MRGRSAPSSRERCASKSSDPLTVECPLTDLQLVSCARVVVAKFFSGKTTMINMVEREELNGMALEAVVIADRKYPSRGIDRQVWVISKSIFLVMDMIRLEARHTVGLSMGEFRGSILDASGNRISPRQMISLDKMLSDSDDRYPRSGIQLGSTEPPSWSNIHNQQLLERLDRVLERLPDQRAAAAFRLIVWHDWTQAEVGELFGVSPSRISQLLTRARVRLRAEFFDLAAERRAA